MCCSFNSVFEGECWDSILKWTTDASPLILLIHFSQLSCSWALFRQFSSQNVVKYTKDIFSRDMYHALWKQEIWGPFVKFVDWRQCADVMQREAVTVTSNWSGGG